MSQHLQFTWIGLCALKRETVLGKVGMLKQMKARLLQAQLPKQALAVMMANASNLHQLRESTWQVETCVVEPTGVLSASRSMQTSTTQICRQS